MTRAMARTRADFKHFTTITTRWADNDIYGHVNNAIHYQLFDTAVNGFLLERGILDFGKTDTVFLVVETGCTYFAEIAFPDDVTAGIAIIRLGGSSVTYDVGLFRNDAETAAAQGRFVHVNVGRQTRRPVPLSAENRKLLQELQAKS